VSLISLAVTLIVIGVLLWLVNTCIPMDGKIKIILNVVVVICVVVWLLFAFGILNHSGDIRVPPDWVAGEPQSHSERNIMLGTIRLIVLIMMLVGAFPAWPHSRSWGYYPSGGLGLLFVILLALVLLGRI
jgi:hypothetical protein